ncbi:MAG: family protein phosphatase [Pseudonocardiales bacterium]|nr:family protein phosphatase [Pseudonocardiales bacterium]
MALYLRYAVRSDLGLVRNNNEDSVYAGPRLLAIADGMGGHAAGEVASKIVIGALEPLDEDRRIDDLMRMLRDTVVEANHRIADAVKQRKDLEGMGTTLTALRFVGSQVGLVHVGDSRAYLLRNDMLTQITHDDTYVQYLVDSGKLSPDEAKDHPRKSVILRALLGSEVEPDVSIREARAGDRYLLCSDGLSDVVSAETIAETMQIEDPQECADRLVELALRGGGPDNVTVIVADVINAKVGDTIDGVPVVDGAFVDPSAADVPGADSAAERAARMARPPRPQPREPLKHRRTFRWRPWLIGLAALIVVIGALGGFYAWTQTQYFVGRAGENVAIFRGVDTEFGPLKFYNVYKVTDLPVSHLQQNYRSQVSDGITASSKDEAQKIVDNLKKGQLQACADLTSPPPTPTPPLTPSSSAGGAATQTHSSSAPATHHSSSPRRRDHVRHSSTAPASRTSTPTTTAPTSAPPTSPSPIAVCPAP